jgi:hypothetical protein
MAASATIVVNRDDPRVLDLASSFPGRQVSFSAAGANGEVALERILAIDANGSRFLLKVAEESHEIYLPVIDKLTPLIVDSADPAELYCQILEHKWYLSEIARQDVGHQVAVEDFLRNFRPA